MIQNRFFLHIPLIRHAHQTNRGTRIARLNLRPMHIHHLLMDRRLILKGHHILRIELANRLVRVAHDALYGLTHGVITVEMEIAQ